jgi:hypothetical protein
MQGLLADLKIYIIEPYALRYTPNSALSEGAACRR